MRSQREWAREYCEEIIRHAKRWCESMGYTLDGQFTYPKVQDGGYATERLQWQAWHVDSLMNAAYAVLVATDPVHDAYKRAREWQYACRCYWQACEYKGQAGGQLADCSWHDEHMRMRGIMDDAMRCIPGGLA